MEHDRALRLGHRFVERQGQENLPGNAPIDKFREIPEAEPIMVVRITDQRTSLPAHLFQPGQSFVDQGFADALLLSFRQDGNRPQALPFGCAVGNDDR
ncbi:hypothetical protein [Desulfosarcina alkanivorans]|uniref:hypothetical protein n=1 Tax=Desulfosarcina alkanivorans TaxID=571177 RepID=UPI002F3EF186